MSRLITSLAIVSAILYLGSCGGDPHAEGRELYSQYCILCHGDDGKREFNGAKDITVSELTLEGRIELITNGRGLMTPFEGILQPEDIKKVAAYSMTLGQD